MTTIDNAALIKLLETLVTYVNKDTNERESGVAEGLYDAAENAEPLAYNHALALQVAEITRALRPTLPTPPVPAENPYRLAAEDAGWRIEGDKFVVRSEPDAGHVSAVPVSDGWQALCKEADIKVWPVIRQKDAWQTYYAFAVGETARDAWNNAHNDDILGEWQEGDVSTFDHSVLFVLDPENIDKELIEEEE